MENNNSQLTEKYKKEVADILSTISIGLGETVLNKIEPEISNLDNKLGQIRKELDVFRKDNVAIYKSIEGNLLTELNRVKEDLEVTNTVVHKIEDVNLNQDRIIEQINTNGSSTNVLIENVTKSLDTIPDTIKGINLSQEKIIEQINANGSSTNVLINNATKTLDIIPKTIQEGNNLITQFSIENSKSTVEIQNSINELVVKKITLIAEKISKIESDSELKNQLKKMVLKQKSIYKFLYILLFILITFFITFVGIFVFQFYQKGI